MALLKNLLRKRKPRKNANNGLSSVSPSPETKTKMAKTDDSFPEIKTLPEYQNDALLYQNNEGMDDIAKKFALAEQYETKEEQDVAVFMALANRMNLESLLYILQGHARELNLPSADCLLPVNAAKIKAERAAAAEAEVEVVKDFQWKLDPKGNVSCDIHEIESVKGYKDLWWQDQEMHAILTSAVQDVKFYQEHRQVYMTAVKTLATQPDNSNSNSQATETHMKTLINDRHGRGLEIHIVGYLEDIRKDYVTAVLDQQDDCEEAEESYETTCDKLREKSLTFSNQSASFALKLAKCDHIIALKASLSKWERLKQASSKRLSPTRCGSGVQKSAAEGGIIHEV